MSLIQLQELLSFDENTLTVAERELLRAARTVPAQAFGGFVAVRITERGSETRDLFHKLRDRRFIIGPLEDLMTGALDIRAAVKPRPRRGEDVYACLFHKRDAETLGIGPQKEISAKHHR